MRVTRAYLPTAPESGSLLELPRDTAQHLVKVLRLQPEDEFVVFCGDGREWSARIAAVRGARVTAAIGEVRRVDRESPLTITLFQSIARGERMDYVVQKATELGVARIVPLLSERSVVRLAAEQSLSKAQHWQAVAASACEQCGRNQVPKVEVPRPLRQVLGDLELEGARLLLDADAGPPDADPADAARLAVTTAVAIAVGPEGGFTSEEREAFAACRFVPVRLGPRILRTETAALAALAWLQSRCGDFRA
jgi:16S rRNA (uracil1498-N3)-methyltransferase